MDKIWTGWKTVTLSKHNGFQIWMEMAKCIAINLRNFTCKQGERS